VCVCVCVCTKFCFELGKNAITIFQMLQKQNKFSLWKSPSSLHTKKTRDVRFSLKCMLIVFYNMRRIVHNKLILQGWNVSQHSYADILGYLWEDVWWESPKNYHTGDLFLHHDNAPVHATLCRNLSSCTLDTAQI
jgi:hypothetical protein